MCIFISDYELKDNFFQTCCLYEWPNSNTKDQLRVYFLPALQGCIFKGISSSLRACVLALF